MHQDATLSTDNSLPSSDRKKHLFIVDGYGFVFRAYHSMPPLTRPDGTPVGALYGFTNMLLKLKDRLRENDDHYMLVVFDAGRKTFRNDIYQEYKAHRPETPEDLRPQFPLVKEAAEAMGLQTLAVEGYEADDIIATYAQMASSQDMKVTIVSSDKDLMQLVDDKVEMYDAMRGRRIGVDEVVEKFGVEPRKVLDVLALMGDSADNIPGVPGIGPKIAAELIERFGSLEEVLENASEIKQKKRRENLIEFADQARMSCDLVKLCYSVPVCNDLEKFHIQPENPQAFIGFLQEQGFSSLVRKIENKHGVSAPVSVVQARDVRQQHGVDHDNAINNDLENSAKGSEFTHHKPMGDVSLLTDKESLVGWIESVTMPKDASLPGLLALLPVGDKHDACIGYALSTLGGKVAYVPLTHRSAQEQATMSLGVDDHVAASKELHQVSFEQFYTAVNNSFDNYNLLLVGYDIKSLLHQGVTCRVYDDVLVMASVLDGSSRGHSLDSLAEQYNLTSWQTIEELVGGKTPLADMSPDDVKIWAAQQVDGLIRLQGIFRQRLFNDRMLSVYETLERPLISALFAMEDAGIKVNMTALNGLSDDFGKGMAQLEQQIYAQANKEFNIGSPKQLGEVLFDDMAIAGGKKSKAGAYGTGADVLEKLSAEGNTIADLVLQWRAFAKLKSTYTDALAALARPDTARVHTTFLMTATNTGRLSSRDPNLQNIPIRTENGRKIRNAFIAERGNLLISADYSQIELRLLAHMAEIEPLQQAFRDGVDVHALTASQVFGVALDQVNSDLRRKAKAINFGIIYGQSAFGLANSLGIGRKDAANYIEKYFTQYPGILQYMDNTKEEARANGYVSTLFGRKCWLAGINAKNGAQRAFAERAAINAPLQGTAADIIKKAMITIDRLLQEKYPQVRMLLQVHDELIFEVPEKDVEVVQALVRKAMEQVVQLSIPLVVDANAATNWGEAH